MNLKAKNRALLAKWVWRYAIEQGALWRSVIKEKYGRSLHCWRFKTTNMKSMSIVWKGIVNNAKEESVEKWVGVDSFRWELGNRKTSWFWENV